MDAVRLILILLTSFNLTMLVMKVWGDKFPQPNARKLHGDWLQGWRNTHNPQNRYWIQLTVMFAILVGFNMAGQMLAGFLVFVRAIVFIQGYRRAKQQIAVIPATENAGEISPSPVDLGSGRADATAPPSSQRPLSQFGRRNQVIVGFIVLIGAALAVTSYLHSRESDPPSVADQQRLDEMSKEMTAPVTLLSVATSDSTQADPAIISTAQEPPVTSATEVTASSEQEPRAAEASAATEPQAEQISSPVKEPVPAQVSSPAAVAPGQPPSFTGNTYGNVVASYFPGESAQDAVMDALSKVNSGLSVDGIDYLGYPEYSLECEANGQCVNGTGTPFGSVTDVAKEMFPVNPVDVQKYELKCQTICYDSQRLIIGRAP